MRPAGAGRSTGFVQLLCDGGTLQLVAGALGLLCLVFDFAWTEPAVPNSWDPPVEDAGLREAIAAVAVMYVFSSVPAAVVFWRFVSVGTLIRAAQLGLGCILVLLVCRSNATSENFYTSANWSGAYWLRAQHMLVVSVLLAGVGYVSSFPFEEQAWATLLLRMLPRRRRTAVPARADAEGAAAAAAAALQEPLLGDPERADAAGSAAVANTSAADTTSEAILDHSSNGSLEDASSARDPDEGAEEVGARDGANDDARISPQRRSRPRRRRRLPGATMMRAFCRASHAPFVFGCSAYILALAVCTFSLVLSFFSFEPNSQCISALNDVFAPKRSLVLESSVRSSFPLGDELQLEFRSYSPNPESTTVVIHDRLSPGNTVWESVRGESFVVAGSASLASWSVVDIFYLSDTTHNLSGKQTIREARSLAGNRVRISGELHMAVGDPLPYEVTFAAREAAVSPPENETAQTASFDMHVNITYPGRLAHGPRVYIVYARDAEERLLGFGSQLSYAGFLRGCIPISVSNKGYGRGLQPFTFFMNRFNQDTGGSWQHVHTAIPSFVSSRGRAAAVRHDALTIFDLVKSDRIGIEVLSPRQGESALVQASFSSVLEPGAENWTRAIFAENLRNMRMVGKNDETAALLQGRESLLPAWSGQGIIVSTGGGWRAVEATLKRYSANGLRVAAVIVRDWAGAVNTGFGYSSSLDWTPDQVRYPDFADFVDKLREATPGLRVLGYFSPNVAATMHHVHPVAPSASRNTTYAEALARNCLVTDENTGKPLIRATDVDGNLHYGIVELLEPRCRAWYEDVLVSAGVDFDGWVADHGDGYPLAKSAESFAVAETETEAHIRFAERWLETATAAGRRVAGAEALVISRTATLRSRPFVQLHSTGEQLVSWDAHDGLASALTGILSSGIAGLPATASYVGGVYRTWDSFGLMRFSRSAELMIRWLELAVFASPTLLTHSGSSLSLRRIPAALELDGLAARDEVQRLFRIHGQLWPLKRRLLAEAQRTGVPMTRGLWVEFPGDPATFALGRQFMLGADLLVCPVMNEGAGGVYCYVPLSPSDRWRFWDDESQALLDVDAHGSSFWCEAPLGLPCVLQRVRQDAPRTT